MRAPRFETVLAQQLRIYAAEFQNHFYESRRLERALRENIVELQHSRQRLVFVEEGVRKEIAELLHGSVQTRMLIASEWLSRCQDLLMTDMGEADALLSRARRELDQIREHAVREASHVLHPSVISIGLGPAVRSLASLFRSEIHISLEVDPALAALDDPFENRIPEPARLAAYRVLEEGLANIYRHAAASSAEVRLSLTPDQHLEITVQDDGGGFDAAHVGHGLGLTSIDDRVAVAGGAWGIAQVDGRGVRLWVRLPLAGLVAVPALRGPGEGVR